MTSFSLSNLFKILPLVSTLGTMLTFFINFKARTFNSRDTSGMAGSKKDVDIVHGTLCVELQAKNLSSGSSCCVYFGGSPWLGHVAFCWEFGRLYGYFCSFYNCQMISS